MSQTPIVVRPAAEADAAAISALLKELGYPLDVAQVKNNILLLFASAGDTIFVAEATSSVVGVLSFHVMPLFHVVGSLGRISSLVISPQWQRRGVGSKLIKAAEEFGWSHDCLRIEVTSGDHRIGAPEFYKKSGYQIDERRFIKRPTAGSQVIAPRLPTASVASFLRSLRRKFRRCASARDLQVYQLLQNTNNSCRGTSNADGQISWYLEIGIQCRQTTC